MAHSLAGRAESRIQARLLSLLRDEGPLSRAELADRLSVSRTTVAAEVMRLAELGLAAEVGPAASRGGRRSTVVDLSADVRFVGISVGATSVSVAVTDGRLGVLTMHSEPCDVRTGPEKVLATSIAQARAVLREQGVDRPVGVGIGVPGPVDFHRGIPVSPPIMPGWDGYPVRDAVSRELGCPALLDNDDTPDASSGEEGGTGNAAAGSNDEEGETVTIGFSAPAADHGWMAQITAAAEAEAEKYGDVELVVAEGTNDVNLQISQVETFINDKVDAIVLLPFDGAALTPIATRAMEAGIPVINVDREFDSPFAARATVLGDNYGVGVSAGTYICEQLDGQTDAVVAEIAGIDSLPLTQDRSQGFKDALSDCGLDVDNRVAAEFTVESGERAAANLLQAAPKIDAIWNHDDDQGVGVMAAIENSGRDEFFVVGGAGSRNVMEEIKSGDSLIEATVIYPSTQGADGIRLARLVAQEKALGDLVEVEVPREIKLFAPVVPAENVDQFLPTAFQS